MHIEVSGNLEWRGDDLFFNGMRIGNKRYKCPESGHRLCYLLGRVVGFVDDPEAISLIETRSRDWLLGLWSIPYDD